MAEDRQEQGSSPEADIIALIERSLVAVRRDQSRRRPQGPWDPGAFPGHTGGHGGHHGAPHDSEHRAAEHRDSAHPDSAHPDSAHPDSAHAAHAFDAHGWGPRGPWAGFPGPFGDSARPGPGRRGRDGSLGRIARIRMLEALAAADAEGRQLSVSSLAAAIGVDQPRASRLVQESVDRGLVRRVPDPSDARRALIQLTTAGRSQLNEAREHRRSAVETALASFTAEEARTFAELFDRFVRAWPR
jgi:DNA-binding MarR family transcriptional regulator